MINYALTHSGKGKCPGCRLIGRHCMSITQIEFPGGEKQ